jgi:hypothetical protein
MTDASVENWSAGTVTTALWQSLPDRVEKKISSLEKVMTVDLRKKDNRASANGDYHMNSHKQYSLTACFVRSIYIRLCALTPAQPFSRKNKAPQMQSSI